MKYARSPYAFHTIGSTMAVSANHYAKVRGFPKREAGEDFYLLNKLAKVKTLGAQGCSRRRSGSHLTTGYLQLYD